MFLNQLSVINSICERRDKISALKERKKERKKERRRERKKAGKQTT